MLTVCVCLYLLHQLFANGVDFGLNALLGLGGVAVVGRRVEAQQVRQGAVVRQAIGFLCGGRQRGQLSPFNINKSS